MYYQKYLKYKTKYINLKNQHGGTDPYKNVTDINLNEQIGILYENILNNNFYKNIYNKFIYLPIKNNIQIIFKYYTYLTCQNTQHNKFDPLVEKCYFQTGDFPYTYSAILVNNYQVYVRNDNHLSKMFNDDYYNFVTYANYTIGKNNITLSNNNYNPIPYIKWRNYFITPTIDPVHNNHILIVNANGMHAANFYFDKNILKDMFDFAILTKQYVYNSIEAGSIPEVIHFHTSSEIPPINNITKIIEGTSPINDNIHLRIYKLSKNEYMCHSGYYFEIEEDQLDDFITKLPDIIFKNIFDATHKYFAQVFILPKIYDFHRLVITFRKVPLQYTIPNAKASQQEFDDKYYEALFGTTHTICTGTTNYRLRYNILGYESIPINSENYPIDIDTLDNNKRVIDLKSKCVEPHINLLKNNYCNVFHYNQTFETNIVTSFPPTNNISQKIYNNIYITPNGATYKTYEIGTVTKIYDIIVNNIFVGNFNNKIYVFEKFTSSVDLTKHIKYSNQIYEQFPLFMAKPLSVVIYNTNTYLIRENIISQITNYNYIKQYSTPLLYAILIYLLHILYTKFNLIFNNIQLNDILIMKIPNNTNNFLKLKFNELESYHIEKDSYDNVIPLLTNLHKLQQGTSQSYNQSLVNLRNIMDGMYHTNHSLDNRKDVYQLLSMSSNINRLSPALKIDSYFNSNTYWRLNQWFITRAATLNGFIDYIITNNAKYIALINKFGSFDIPENTYFVLGANFREGATTNNNIDHIIDNYWYYDTKQTQWFNSNFDVGTIINNINTSIPGEQNHYNSINYKGLDGCNATYYIGRYPENLGRHLIFKNSKKLIMFLSSFDVNTRTNNQQTFIFTILNDYFNSINKQNYIKIPFDGTLNGGAPIGLDEVFTFICEIFKSRKLFVYDGYFGMDFMEKKKIIANSETNIEYVIFEPNVLTFLGVYMYDYYANKCILYRNINDWLDKLKKLINLFYNKPFLDTYEFNTDDIIYYYTLNLNFIANDLLILKNNDFWNGNNKPVEFVNDIIQNISL
jgi:hypothetical protein